MEDLLATQYQIMGAIKQLLSNFKKDGSDRKTTSYIKKRLETLDAYWQEFQLNHIKLGEYEDQSHTYFIENYYEKTLQFFNDTRAYINSFVPGELKIDERSFIRPATPLLTAKVSEQQAEQITPRSDIQMDNVPTPKFEFPHMSVAGNTHPPQFKSGGNQSRLAEMLRKQQSNFKAFARTVNNINLNISKENWELEDILRSVNQRWAAIDDLHWEIDSELYEENVEYEQQYSKYEQKYQEIKKNINQLIRSTCHREKSTPQMDIPNFSGNYHQWLSFKDLFSEAIHNNRSLSNAQKMQYLKGKVRGEAEKIIQHLHISSENYQVCWDLLNHRYENKKLIFASHINLLLNLPTSQQQSAATIKKIHDAINESLNSIKNLGIDISSWDPLIVHLMTQKLDAESHKDYIESLKNPRELPKLCDFLEFLENKFTSLESSRRKQDTASKVTLPEVPKKSSYFKSFNNNQNQFHHTQKKIATAGCPLCKSDHGIFHCSNFLKLQPTERRNLITKLNYCVNCLYDHFGKKCISDKRCRECEGRHNTLIHGAFVQQPSTERKSGTHVSQNDITETLLATAIVKVQKFDGTFISLRALIDQGSQTSLISENAAQMLRLPREWCKGVIFGIGAKENSCKGTIKITCSSSYSDYQFNTEVFIMKSLINNLPNHTFTKSTWPSLENIKLADPDYNVSRQVDLLLGADVYSLIILGGIISLGQEQPVAQQTRLGWILCGNVTKSYHCNVVINNLEEIKQFWEIEDVPSDISMSQEDIECVNYFKSTTTRQPDGKYVVKYPLVQNAEERLGESKSKAIAQLKQLEKRFTKNEDLEKEYKLFIREYINLGHMQLSTSNTTPSVYLPHHAVLRAESLTTALRVVFNAASKTSSGESLNDVMLRGPNLQQELISLIIKWRQYRYAYTADVEKMFRGIILHEDHQRYQKILWRESSTHPIKEYQLSTISYGTKAAPFLAMMVLKQLAQDESPGFESSPAPKILQEQFYMDDLLHGNHNISAAKKVQNDLINLLKKGGFNLRKWASNTPELLQNVETVSNQQSYNFKHNESTKTLGLRWHPESDIFTFELKINLSQSKFTKRTLLSNISKLFDPLGWLTPVTIKLKLLFQKIWLHDLSWDAELPTEINKEWMNIREDLKNIISFNIPRWIQTCENDVIELHGFCDASVNAYACVIYCKVNKKYLSENQSNLIVLVAAKSRLVPPKRVVSLPRLELCATELLSKLMEKVKACLIGYEIHTFGWCDSTAVLGWLQGDPGRWTTFVANRVIKVTNILPPNSWRYVKSSENPADCATRGISMEQLHQHPLWWHGPSWLQNFEKESEKELPNYVTNEESKKSKQTNVSTYSLDDDVIMRLLNRHSSFTRVTRILAYVLRMRKRNIKQIYLTVPELRLARLKIIKHVQELEFGEDISYLQKHKAVHPKSKLLSLNPLLDSDGLLRVGGRLKEANISENMRHPFIIPHSSQLTTLLIDHAHKMTYHGGSRVTLAWLRQQYWIIGGNRAVKSRLTRCVTCKRHNPQKQYQLMGNLPESRSNPSRPFYHTGVDFTGYVDVKASKGRGSKISKGYISVFVCMATKAVHLELVSDLSSSTFLAALRRMAARRGTPQHLYSDNGTNFVGANRLLKQEMVNWKSVINDELMSDISQMDITWHFNAPSWPSGGGLWESMVRSLKHHLRRVIGQQKLTYEEFSTLLAQLEGCLNSRPLCALSEDPEDINYLTPSHFLASGPVLTVIETERDQRTRWQLTQRIFDDIWKRWKSEYLTQLTSRSKWRQAKDNIKLNDVVIIQDANLPAGKWALGRVIDLHPGNDGHVRVVTVKTRSGVMKRPVTKLSPLPTNNETRDQTTSNINQIPTTSDSSKAKQTKRTRSKLTNLITLPLLLLFMFTTAVEGAYYNISTFKDTQSLYFDKVSDMRLIRDQWKMVVYYDVDPYWQGSQLLKQYIVHLENMCSIIQKQAHCNVILLQLRHGYSELLHYDQLLLGQRSGARTLRRRRRGLINGLGNVAHALIGVLDDKFAEQYQKDIALVKSDQKHLSKLLKNQTSVIQAQYHFLQRLETAIDQQHKSFNQHLLDIEKQNTVLKKEVERADSINEFILSSITANNILDNMRRIQENLLDTVTDIYHGKFDIHLLSPEQLKDELSIISSHLSKDLSLPIDNIHSDVSKLYHLLRVRVKFTEQYLLLEIKIPLITRDNYDLYKLIPIPQHTENNKTIIITPISNYITINIQRDSYLPMFETDLHTCMHVDLTTKLCALQGPVYQMKRDQDLCEINHTTQTCQATENSCKNMWKALTQSNHYLFYCCDQCTIRFMCGGHVSVERISRAGVLTMASDCMLKSDSFILYSHNEQTNEVLSHADLILVDVPPINNIINLPVHRGDQDYQLNITERNIRERQSSLKEIGRQIEQMKSDEVEVDATSFSSHDIHHYVVIYILVGVCCAAGAAFLWRRVRRRCRSLPSGASASFQRAADAGPPLPPPPRPAARLSLSDITSACANESDSVNYSVPDLSAKSKVSVPQSARINKASSPIIKFKFTADNNESS